MMRWLSLVLFIAVASSGCSMNKATQGAMAGAALGAGTGAIIGDQHGKAGAGTAIGAAAGALGGALVGNAFDQTDRQHEEMRRELASNETRIEENKRLIEELRRRGADVRNSRRGVVINLPDILFEFDSSYLTPEAKRTLGEISGVLSSVRDRRISVEGHTDAIGTVTYNKRLSLSRANHVAEELAYNGIPRGQMRVRGYGEGRPIATNNSSEGRARNRRVEVIIEN